MFHNLNSDSINILLLCTMHIDRRKQRNEFTQITIVYQHLEIHQLLKIPFFEVGYLFITLFNTHILNCETKC